MRLFCILIFTYLTTTLTEAIGQPVATANCTGSTVSLTGGLPSYANNAFAIPVGSPGCGFTTLTSPLTHRIYLEKLNFATGAFEVVSGPQPAHLNTFDNVPHGIYRLKVQIPGHVILPNCSGGLKKAYNYAGQHIGYGGRYLTEAEGGMFFSNEVAIGATVQNDLTYSFVDGGGGNSLPNGFDYTETATINTTGSQNYESWWLAITELGGWQRYKSIGWTPGILPTTIDLSAIWATDGWGQFISLNSYRVQLAISNSCDSQWTVLEKDFFVCPSGSGCRVAEKEAKITISPNPAYNSFRLMNFDLAAYQQDDLALTITDMSGRRIKSFSSVSAEACDISDIEGGLYIVNLWNGTKRLHVAKLSVLRP